MSVATYRAVKSTVQQNWRVTSQIYSCYTTHVGKIRDRINIFFSQTDVPWNVFSVLDFRESSGLARVFGYTVYRGFLNRVYGILQLKYGYLVYHFLWISVYVGIILGIFGWILGILTIFFQVYWYTTTPPPRPTLNHEITYSFCSQRDV